VKKIECSAIAPSREEARRRGLKYYASSKPCPYGHTVGRRVKCGSCLECNRIRGRQDGALPPALTRTEVLRLQYAEVPPGSIISRTDAKTRGLPRYFPGSACANGHVGERYTTSKGCVQCLRERPRRPYRLKSQERSAGRQRPTRCEVCGDESTICFDHCHAKGHFRGWLCTGCNRALGFVNDNPEKLRRLAEYLEQGQVWVPKTTSP
jgi:Recombination endonuclease VII